MFVRRLALLALLAAAPAAAQGSRDTSARADSTAPLSLVREVFSYEGGGRDPFVSLLATGEVSPIITDLRLVAVYYDERYTARSVAVLRDRTTGKRYRVKTGDVIARLRVTQIRPREVVFTVQEFGYERQQTLSLRQEESP